MAGPSDKPTGFEFEDVLEFPVAGDEGPVIVQRLDETHFDEEGRVFVLRLDQFAYALGPKWETKQEQIWDFLRNGFEKKFVAPDWCARIGEMAFMAVLPTQGARAGALASAALWRDLVAFFLGDAARVELPLYEVTVAGYGLLSLRRIDLRYFFDRIKPEVQEAPVKSDPSFFATRIEGEGGGGPGTARAMTGLSSEEPAPAVAKTKGQIAAAFAAGLAQKLQGMDSDGVGFARLMGDDGDEAKRSSAPTKTQDKLNALGGGMARPVEPPARKTNWSASVVLSGQPMKLACHVEPVYEMKKVVQIGHRIQPEVLDLGTQTILSARAMANLEWTQRAKIDLANVLQGMKLLEMKPAPERKIVVVIPATFQTFASTRARQKLIMDASTTASALSLKILFEIRDLDGVPPHRILEVVSLIKPFCVTVIGTVSADKKAIEGLNRCGLAGIAFEYDGLERDDLELAEYLMPLTSAARTAAGACMVQGLISYRHLAVARNCGVTHASIFAQGLMTPALAANP